MCFELAAYGLVSGLMYRRLPKKTVSIYASLIVAMIAGRVVWGVAQAILLGLTGSALTWKMFITSAVLNAIPGIVIHIVLIPVIVMALKRALPSLRR